MMRSARRRVVAAGVATIRPPWPCRQMTPHRVRRSGWTASREPRCARPCRRSRSIRASRAELAVTAYSRHGRRGPSTDSASDRCCFANGSSASSPTPTQPKFDAIKASTSNTCGLLERHGSGLGPDRRLRVIILSRCDMHLNPRDRSPRASGLDSRQNIQDSLSTQRI